MMLVGSDWMALVSMISSTDSKFNRKTVVLEAGHLLD